MAIQNDYTSGTVSVAAGGTTLTGVGTAWKTFGIRAGDTFMKSGYIVVVMADATSETSLSIEAWPGSALSGASYRIRFQPDGSRYSAAARALVELIADGNVEALAGLTSAADKLGYFTGAGTMGVTGLSPYMRTLLDDLSADAAQTTLGGGAVGKAAFAAATRGAFLTGSTISYNLGNIADDGVASFTAGGGFEAALVAILGNTSSIAGLFAARTHTSSPSCAKLLQSTNLMTAYATPLAGTTGADGSINVGAHTDGKIYVENRTGAALPFYAHILKAL